MKTRNGPKTVVITGASAGLGAALAEAYAAPGRTLALLGRNQDRLEAVAKICRARDASVVIAVLDVTDAEAVSAWVAAYTTHTVIDLLIASAGVFTGNGPGSHKETVADVAWMSRINLEGVANVVQPVLAGMRKRRGGHVAIVGSLAAIHPLADAPGYSASKAGVMAYGEALRESLMEDGVAVSLVYPGHFETAMVADHVGPLPYLMPVAEAAARTKRGLDRGQTFIAFPWQLLWLIRVGRMLPWRLRALSGRDLRFHVKRDPNADT
jgi:short-subunit dehydrogenase